MEEDLGGERGAWNGGGFGRREGGLEWRRILEEGGGLGLRLYCAAVYVLSRDYRYS